MTRRPAPALPEASLRGRQGGLPACRAEATRLRSAGTTRGRAVGCGRSDLGIWMALGRWFGARRGPSGVDHRPLRGTPDRPCLASVRGRQAGSIAPGSSASSLSTPVRPLERQTSEPTPEPPSHARSRTPAADWWSCGSRGKPSVRGSAPGPVKPLVEGPFAPHACHRGGRGAPATRVATRPVGVPTS